jgi:hypothetical protein
VAGSPPPQLQGVSVSGARMHVFPPRLYSMVIRYTENFTFAPVTHLHLVPRSRMVELGFHSPIRLHGVVLNNFTFAPSCHGNMARLETIWALWGNFFTGFLGCWTSSVGKVTGRGRVAIPSCNKDFCLLNFSANCVRQVRPFAKMNRTSSQACPWAIARMYACIVEDEHFRYSLNF